MGLERQHEELKERFLRTAPALYEAKIGKALPGINGDESWELPVSAPTVIARDGSIVLADVEVDYRRCLEPGAILDAVQSLRPS